MKRTALIASLASPLIAAALLVTSPVSCGCEPEWPGFLSRMGVEANTSESSLEQHVIEPAARGRFVGRPIEELHTTATMRLATCRTRTEQAFDCDFWVREALLRDTGFRIQATAADGKVTSVDVSNASRWFGRQE